MTEPVEIWFCTGPRCAAVGGADLLSVARKHISVRAGAVRLCTRNCFSRCELDPAPLPSVRVDGDWLFPVDRRALVNRMNELAEAAGDE